MSQKNALIAGVIVVVIGLVAFLFLSQKGETEIQNPTSASLETTNPNVTTLSDSGDTTAPGLYAMSEVAKHNSASSCWTTIHGNVYDVTNWISQHPGGSDAILSLCGTDGTAAFTDQHSGQARPANELASFKIGTLAK